LKDSKKRDIGSMIPEYYPCGDIDEYQGIIIIILLFVYYLNNMNQL
jgi:hypothetical protein